MGVMRSFLLWGSRSTALRRVLPQLGFVRRAVARFMPGENIEDALDAAEAMRKHGIAAIVTHLGENLQHEGEADAVAEHYLGVLDRIRKRGLDCHVSLKLTQLGLDLSSDLCMGHLSRIVGRAKDLRNVVWIDMESSSYVDRTLEVFRRIRAEHLNVGVCLQSYLHRTSSDLDMLAPLVPSIRLVKGTYAEPKDVAFRSKRDVDENFYVLAMRLLESTPAGSVKAGIATHDLGLLDRIHRGAAERGVPKDAYEIQMLYGIKREQQLEFARRGFRARVLISYGTFWFPWYMRRLAERPANVLFVLKNVFSK